MNHDIPTYSPANTKQHDTTPFMTTESINHQIEDDGSDSDASSTVSSLPWWGMSIKPDSNYNWENDPFNPVNFSKPFVPPVEITIVTTIPIIEKAEDKQDQHDQDQQEQNLGVKSSPTRKMSSSPIFSMMKTMKQQLPSFAYRLPLNGTDSRADTNTLPSMEETDEGTVVSSFDRSEKMYNHPYYFEYSKHQNQAEEEGAERGSEDGKNDDVYNNDLLAGKHRKGMIRREFERRIKASLGLTTVQTNHEGTTTDTTSKENNNTQDEDDFKRENDDHKIDLNEKRIPSFVMV